MLKVGNQCEEPGGSQMSWVRRIRRSATMTWLLFSLIVLLLISLNGCGENFVPTPTLAASPTPVLPTPPPTNTPETWVGREIAAAYLTLSLPDTWIIGESRLTPLGLVINLGTEPLGPGPASSTLIIADPEQIEVEQLAAALSCNEPCAIPFETATIAGRPAQRAILGSDTSTPLEWYFLQHGGQLLAFTIHDATTLLTREDILSTIRLIERVIILPTATPTETPLPPTATPTLPPPTVTPGPPTAQPLDVVIAFLTATATDPDLLAIPYLSDTLRQAISDGETVLSLLSLTEKFITFELTFLGTIEEQLTYRTRLRFTNGQEVWRLIQVIAEDGQWVMNGFIVIEPPPQTPTLTPELSTPTPTSTPEE